MDALILFLFWAILCLVSGNDILVGDLSLLNAEISTSQPGDMIIIENGVYEDPIDIEFVAYGTVQNPITLRSETPGGVVFSGNVGYFITMTGMHLVLSGFHFKDLTGFLGLEMVNATNCRVTDNYFENVGTGAGVIEIRGLNHKLEEYIGPSTYNRVDHNTFERIASSTVCIEVFFVSIPRYGSDDLENKHNVFDHNFFKNSTGSSNAEAFQIGRGSYNFPKEFMTEANTTIEYNIFHNFNKDNELMSIKSSSNTIRRNVIKNCDAAITLRGGNNCTVEGNYVYTDYSVSLKFHKGIRFNGKGHKLINNYIEAETRLYLSDWTISNGEYYSDTSDLGLNTPEYLYVEDSYLSRGTIGSLSSGEWDWDPVNKRAYVKDDPVGKIVWVFIDQGGRILSFGGNSPDVIGTVTLTPQVGNSHILTDGNANWEDGQYNGKYVWITENGIKDGVYFVNNTIASPTPQLHCLTEGVDSDKADLLSDGVKAGDSYILKGNYLNPEDVLIANNVVVNSKRGIELTNSSYGNACSNCNVVNNIAESYIYSSMFVDDGAIAMGTEYHNNLAFTFSGLAIDVDITSGVTETGSYTLTDHNASCGLSICMYRPEVGGSADGAGISLPDVTTDIDSQPRNANTPDIGCDEISQEPVISHPVSPSEVGIQWETNLHETLSTPDTVTFGFTTDVASTTNPSLEVESSSHHLDWAFFQLVFFF